MGAGANYSALESIGVAQKYRDAVAAFAAERNSSLTTIQNAAIATPNGYDLNRQSSTNLTGTAFNFVSGASTLGGTGPATDSTYVLPNGLTAGTYLTATNILTATDSGGNTFVNRIATVSGADFATTIVPIYEATRQTVAEIVKSGPTSEMLSFWEVGLANGSFPNTTEGIQTAISNFAAATTLSIIEKDSAGHGAWTVLGSRGVATAYA